MVIMLLMSLSMQSRKRWIKKDPHPLPGQLFCCTVPFQSVPVQIFYKTQIRITEQKHPGQNHLTQSLRHLWTLTSTAVTTQPPHCHNHLVLRYFHPASWLLPLPRARLPHRRVQHLLSGFRLPVDLQGPGCQGGGLEGPWLHLRLQQPDHCSQLEPVHQSSNFTLLSM